MQAGLETFNQQPCSPESCHSVTLAKVLLFGKAAPFLAKKVTAVISGAVNTLAIGLQDLFFLPTPLGFRHVVQHVQLHVA